MRQNQMIQAVEDQDQSISSNRNTQRHNIIEQHVKCQREALSQKKKRIEAEIETPSTHYPKSVFHTLGLSHSEAEAYMIPM
jgi:hypothetical protein